MISLPVVPPTQRLPLLLNLVVFVVSCLREREGGGAPAGLRAILDR